MLIAAEIEDERKMNNPPTFHGYAYSRETSDDDDPNDAYYYAGQQIYFYSPEITMLIYDIETMHIDVKIICFAKLQTQIVNQKIVNLIYKVRIHSTTL